MKKILTGSTLKIIAVVSMLLDHFSKIILEEGIILHAPYSMFTDTQFGILMTASDILQVLGRIAFPVFCFLLVEGFLHTHDLKRYFLIWQYLPLSLNPFMIWQIREQPLA